MAISYTDTNLYFRADSCYSLVVNMMAAVNNAKRELKLKHKLRDMNSLSYIGHTDCSVLKPGLKLLYFNVNQPGHLKHRSTLGCQVGKDGNICQ